MACFAVCGATAEAALAAGFCAVLVVLSVIDANERIVPNRIVLPAAAVALVAQTAIDPSPAWLAWALIASGSLFLVVLAYPKGLGMGDVKLALLLGAVLGSSVTVALMLGLFAALVPAAVLVVAARRLGEEDGRSARPVPLIRRGGGAVLRRCDPRGVSRALLAVSRQGVLGICR